MARMRFVADRVASARQWLGSAESFVRSNQEAILIAVGIVVLLVAMWLVVRWIRRPMSARLLRVLAQREEVTVLMHPNPDPDAMACGMGIALLAEHVGTRATLQYPGQVRHQENRAFRTVLDVEMENITNVDDLASPDVVLVDHNHPRGFEGASRIQPYAVIDHHPGNGTGQAFTDKRTDYGACSTIVAEYFHELDSKMANVPHIGDADLVVPPAVATGLLYGIQADTKHLTSGCSQADFEASAYLYAGIDEDSLDRIANPQVSVEVLEVKARAIWQRDVRGSFAVSDIGTISNIDAIPQAADELIQLEGVTAVIVYGNREGTLHFSGRSRDDRVHMGDVLEAVLADVPGADGGGHARMGGGQMPVEDERELGAGDAEAGLVTYANVTDRLFDAMNGDL